ncbi:hypothetical protein OGAPHI_004478 [Ogataea philodendri]|uniref:Uncharacterized protein n=1 Tax=Ogataea philodendri TaxID=1378263 RepID=A0A9P8T5H1_9ASCO|nr:uncharacterized protein OGAPHI_004478 [Ogataea philodendri]KAH3666289.1 hypothetical protein OGAPHI_004478 [Ogataea philodendri]
MVLASQRRTCVQYVDSENLVPSEYVPPLANIGRTPKIEAVPWYSGMDVYMLVCLEIRMACEKKKLAKNTFLQEFTADLGRPEVPLVKISNAGL